MRTRDFSALVEARIREAEARGAFDDLPGKGKPMPKDDLAGLPYDDRIAALIHRCAGGAPEEVELLRDIAALRKTIAEESDPLKAKARRKELEQKRMRLSILFEGSGRGVLLHSLLADEDET